MWFGVDTQFFFRSDAMRRRERAFLAQPGVVTEEIQAAGSMKFKQPRQEQAAEQFGQDTDRQQKSRPGRYPALSIERDTATGHDHVDVRMVCHRRAPGAQQHGGDANARAEMTPVNGEGKNVLLRRPEQQVVHDRLVVEGDVGASSAGMLKTTWKYPTGRLASRLASQVRAAAPWHSGQCRLRQLL